MPDADCRRLEQVVLYARVSTSEQAEHGFSLAQQIEALREHCAREGYEVLEEVSDPGQSGASLERPGMDRVRDLVTAGGVTLVLAQDRDRFAREPAYHYLLQREFEEHGAKLRSLNDRSDESPEGELTDGILDQLAKYERAKTAERTRRGRLRKARQGKMVAFRILNYGFGFNAARDGYEVDEEAMRVVRRVVRLVGVEGMTLHGVARVLEDEGVRTPTGGKHWDLRVIKGFVVDDVYKPHTFEEVAGLVAPEVATQLDPSEKYGIWWYNRRRVTQTQVTETGPEGGRRYRKRSRYTLKERDEWIAVPVPDSGIPREVVEAAREAVKDNRKLSYSGERFWELSGGVMYCHSCGRRMTKHTASYTRKSGEKARRHYYRCPKAARHRDVCPLAKHFRADGLESRTWEFVSGLLRDPDRLRASLDRMIEEEGEGLRGDPGREIESWLDKLAEIERKRGTFQDMAAEGLITFEELRAKLGSWGRPARPRKGNSKPCGAGERWRRRWSGTATRSLGPTPRWCRRRSRA